MPFEALAGRNSPFPGRIWWNFAKFLVGRDGEILGRFGSRVKPDSTKLVQAVEAALAGK
jgi:glutathione peroxidase